MISKMNSLKMIFMVEKNNTDIYEIRGVIKKVVGPNTFVEPGIKTYMNEVILGIKTDDDKRVLCKLNGKIMGWSGNLKESRIWYYTNVNNAYIGMSVKDFERYIGYRVRIKGKISAINAKNKKYKVDYLGELILYFD